MTSVQQVSVDDGTFDVHVWLPPKGTGPGLVLVQEIFGVGAYIKAVGERLAQRGYVVAAPDLFWRFAPGHAADHDEAGLAQSMELVGQLDPERAVSDCLATMAHLQGMDEVTGPVGAIGFCLGGAVTVGMAIAGDPACVVSYYGSGVAAMAEQFSAVTCPVLLHFGDSDPFIPNRDVETIREAITGREHWQLEVQPGAGHAFDNHEAELFHDPVAATNAWAITERFLALHLPTGPTPE
jgi:carboxymethylenebutenolidase